MVNVPLTLCGFVVLGLLATTACSPRGDKKKCTEATRNFYSLTFWHRADKEIAAAPEEQRLGLRRQKETAFQAELDKSLDMEASKCVAAADDDRALCMIKAKTCAEAKKCMPDDAKGMQDACP
jgi:hypothetical protein